MALDFLWPHLGAILEAATLKEADGLQIVEATAVAAQHHPPLNPDFPALLAQRGAPQGEALARVLRNQYPETHPLRALYPTAQKLRAEPCTVSTLTAHTWPQDVAWGALVVFPWPRPASFERFQETIAHLRAPEGCPWDRKQTHRSLRPYLLEEAYEVLEALDTDDVARLREELGDLLLQIVLHSQIAVEAGEFRMADVIAGVNAKIVRRHPHVWGDVHVESAEDVTRNWDQIKQAEKGENGEAKPKSRLDGVPKGLPALAQAHSYQARAARVGFDWETIEPLIAKVYEEIEELKAATTPAEREAELGDLLFAVVNWARWLKIDAEAALRNANARFARRFQHVEARAAADGRPLQELTLAEMDALWDDAKARGL